MFLLNLQKLYFVVTDLQFPDLPTLALSHELTLVQVCTYGCSQGAISRATRRPCNIFLRSPEALSPQVPQDAADRHHYSCKDPMNLLFPIYLPQRSARAYIFTDVQGQEQVVSHRLTASSAFFIIHRDFYPKYAMCTGKPLSFPMTS